MLTVADLISRYIDEMNGTNGQPGVKTLGSTHLYALRAMARRPIGQLAAATLNKHDIIEYAKERRKTVAPSTVLQDMAYLAGPLKYAPAVWEDCEAFSGAAPIAIAKPMLVKYGLIAKGQPRRRIPTDEEIGLLVAHFASKKWTGRSDIPMADILLFALCSTRRRGEICRMLWSDIDWDRKDKEGNPTPMYMVRDIKHPLYTKGNHKWFPLFPELAEIINRQPRTAERVFPYRGQTVGHAYIRAKAKLGITGLRFHDSRRHAITHWLALLKSPHQVKLISGHATTLILERVYDVSDPAKLHAAVESATQAQQH